MKLQWNFILALLSAIIIAIFAVANVEGISVHYLLGKTEKPLIIVVLGSTVTGGIIIGSIGRFRLFMLRRQVKM
ncbi:lipopolysaccharide assembly protein LapA domain-containing protein [Thermaerobacillus caldiproteolyticus]|uniref:Putative integral membrane protein n=1 Tax=Thermaerobacillus caldiproteolyticus TaxID=247480 RepID=A0A7W0C0P4_9BACL|nr:lipopolysaccharide assembly protein LapA domain-containing protein [Anoxybacillus caldiproteolyticus]MBA2875619.1 putative integral membrane protein [Anoxybacillus caldiproteolyticus]QPA30535.1 DUF1049 domain-containing protein [Anoxybacillus caldiproteolyticus]